MDTNDWGRSGSGEQMILSSRPRHQNLDRFNGDAGSDLRKPTDLKKAVLSRNISRQNLSSIPTFLDLHSRSNDADTFKMLNIKDVDVEDHQSPTHISEFVTDIYRYLRWKELQFVLEENYLTNRKVTPKNRATLFDWLVNVHRMFKLLPETLHLTLRLIDTYCNAANPPNRAYQLVGVTCLWIACKFEEIYVPNTDDFLYITENAFDLHELCECERSITNSIKFNLNPPTSLAFLKRAAKVAQVQSRPYNMAKYVLELGFLSYEVTHYLPSHQAAAALLLTSVLYNKIQSDRNPQLTKPVRDLWTKECVYYTGYNVQDLTDLSSKFANILESLSSNSDKSEVFKKYKSPNLDSVSGMPVCLCASRVFEKYMSNHTDIKITQSGALAEIDANTFGMVKKIDSLNIK